MKRHLALILGCGVMLYGVVSLATIGVAQPGTWAKRADMPTPRWGLSTCEVNGEIYAIGGWRPGSFLARTVETYNPTTDAWTKKADIPTPRFLPSASVVAGKIYVIGGGDMTAH